MSLNFSLDFEKLNCFKVWRKNNFLEKKVYIEFMNLWFSKIVVVIVNFL